VYVGDFSPNVRPIAALRARMLAAQGHGADALVWVRECGVAPDDDLSSIREFEHTTLAMVLPAQPRTQRAERPLDDAAQLLQRLLHAAEAAERTGSVIEILVLQGLVQQARGDAEAALAPLQRATTLAEPEGYVRVFVGHGRPMASLLGRLAQQGKPGDYVHRLVLACSEPASVSSGAVPTQGRPVDPLSEREMDVLRLLGSELSGPDIARELLVSLNTLRTHTKSIYAKLGVNSRRAAVRQAAQLRLLSRSRDT
jgi:LuxR family transcriptional regulator, maltose regulon positive regulatory protein